MYIVVVGCGKVGYHLAKALVAAHHEVLVVERDRARVGRLEEEMGSITLVGDGCELGVLEEAGANRADIVIATTGSDPDNLVACQVARHCFQVGRTISLVNNTSNQALFGDLGVDVPVSSTEIIMKNIEEELPTHPMVHLLNLNGSRREIVVITLPPESATVGRPLSEVDLPPDSYVSLVIRQGKDPQAAGDNPTLEARDQLLCVTVADQEEELLSTLTEVA